MSDLPQRLRLNATIPLVMQAAARIEALEADHVNKEICDSYALENQRFYDRIEALEAALNYVADMTYCGADAEWHFKPGYDPQAVLDALAGSQDK